MDSRQNLQILRDFPLLLPQKEDFTVFDGFMSAGGEEFRIYIALQNPTSVKGLIFCCSLNVRYFLESCKNNLKEWESSGISLFEFLVRLQNLIAVGVQHGKISKNISLSCVNNLQETIELYSWIVNEMHTWSEGISLESTMEGELNEILIRFYKEDSYGRNHKAMLKLEPGTQGSSIIADIPTQVELTVQKGMTVSQIYETFVDQIESLQNFWNIMDCIDGKCWVIDPEQPRRKDTYRRIVLGTNITMYINFDPLDLYKRPDITFIGSERTIMPYRNALEENLEYLDGLGVDVVESLASALGLSEFPPKPVNEGINDEGIEQGECSICLCLRMDDGQLPSEVCNNPLCALPFHATCLFMWLQSFPMSHQNFNRLYGECPNCNSAISCPLTT